MSLLRERVRYKLQLLCVLLFFDSLAYIDVPKVSSKAYIKKLNGVEVDGRVMKVFSPTFEDESSPSDTLYIRNLNPKFKKNPLKTYFTGCTSIHLRYKKKSTEGYVEIDII